jgi:hypothetical protein
MLWHDHGSRHPASGIRHPASGIRHPASGKETISSDDLTYAWVETIRRGPDGPRSLRSHGNGRSRDMQY